MKLVATAELVTSVAYGPEYRINNRVASLHRFHKTIAEAYAVDTTTTNFQAGGGHRTMYRLYEKGR